MNPALPIWVVFVGAATTLSPAERRRDLDREIAAASARWGARWTRVPELEPPASHAGDAFAAELEALLDTARTALGALRPAEAQQALTDAERMLEAHPDLPQAAWLTAERASLGAELLRDRDPQTAEALRLRAFALEGPRADAFGEKVVDMEATKLPALTVRVRGLSPGDRLEWDGESVKSELESVAGEHQARVFRGERLVWASWVRVSAHERELALHVAPREPCSAEDLERTRDGGSGPIAEAETLCPQWAVARASGDALAIAFCQRGTCAHWQSAPSTAQPRNAALRPRALPWGIYAAAGIGAAIIASAVLVGSGVFQSSPTRERWMYEGLH